MFSEKLHVNRIVAQRKCEDFRVHILRARATSASDYTMEWALTSGSNVGPNILRAIDPIVVMPVRQLDIASRMSDLSRGRRSPISNSSGSGKLETEQYTSFTRINRQMRTEKHPK